MRQLVSRLRRSLVGATVLCLAATASAGATSPGTNGAIAIGLFPETGTTWRIDLVRTDGQPAGELGVGLSQLLFFQWSPDGSRLLGSYDPFPATSRPRGWYVATRDERTWTALPDQVSYATWLPGDRILLLRSTPAGSLWSVGADGTGLRQLPASLPAGVGGMVAAPDGKAAYFTVDGNIFTSQPDEIRRIDLATGATRRVLAQAATGGLPTIGVNDISPDGRTLLVGRETTGQPSGGGTTTPAELVLIGVDGSGRRRVPTTAGDRPFGRFSPDGKQIAYLGTRTSPDAGAQDPLAVDLRVIGVDGSGDKSLGAYPATAQNGFSGMAWQPLKRVVISGVVTGGTTAAAPLRAASAATVVATGAQGTFTAPIGAGGRFQLAVEPGSYRLAVRGRSGCIVLAGRCARDQEIDVARDVRVTLLADPPRTRLALGLAPGARLAAARNRVAIPVRCVARTTCRGTVRLRKGRRAIASARVTVKAGKARTITLRIGTRRGAMTARATAGGTTTSVAIRIR